MKSNFSKSNLFTIYIFFAASFLLSEIQANLCSTGFSGSNCTKESYRSFYVADFDGSNSIELVDFVIGGTWSTSPGENPQIIQFNVNFLLSALNPTQNSIVFYLKSSSGQHSISLEIDPSGILLFRSECYTNEHGSLTSSSPISLNQWNRVAISIEGSLYSTCDESNNYTRGLMYINDELHSNKTGISFPFSISRDERFVGKDFIGKVDSLSIYQFAKNNPSGWSHVDPSENICKKSDSLMLNCDFSYVDSSCTLDTNISLSEENSLYYESYSRFDYGMYVWTHDNGNFGWYFQLQLEESRNNLIQTATQRNISFLLVSNRCPSDEGCDFCNDGSNWHLKDYQDLLSKAHKNNIKIYATYTDASAGSDVFNWNKYATENSLDKIDGIAVNFEDFNFQTEGYKFIKELNDTIKWANLTGIPVHISVSFIWATVNFTGNESIIDRSIKMLKSGDSIDIQVSHRDHCVYQNRAEYIIKNAQSKGIKVYIDMETKDDADFSGYSWYKFGENAMWSSITRSYHEPGNLPVHGFIFHHYKDGFNTGGLWPSVGLTACSQNRTRDACDVCGGDGSSCNWSNLYLSQCGDSVCQGNSGETCVTCSKDCPKNGNSSQFKTNSNSCSASFCTNLMVDFSYYNGTTGNNSNNKNKSNNMIGPIVGSICGFIGLTLLVVVSFVLIRKKLRKSKEKVQESPTTKMMKALEREPNQGSELPNKAVSNIRISSTSVSTTATTPPLTAHTSRNHQNNTTNISLSMSNTAIPTIAQQKEREMQNARTTIDSERPRSSRSRRSTSSKSMKTPSPSQNVENNEENKFMSVRKSSNLPPIDPSSSKLKKSNSPKTALTRDYSEISVPKRNSETLNQLKSKPPSILTDEPRSEDRSNRSLLDHASPEFGSKSKKPLPPLMLHSNSNLTLSKIPGIISDSNSHSNYSNVDK